MDLSNYDFTSLITTETTPTDIVISFIISTIITLLTFSLKAVAIQTMAKKRGYDKLYLAWIPFLNFILLGKLVGETVLWGFKVKNLGLLVCVLYAVTFTMVAFLNLGYYVNRFEIVFNFKVQFKSDFVKNWMSGAGTLFSIVNILHTVISLVEIFTKASLIYCIFRQYCPERAFIYMIVSVLVDALFGPILFIIRNRNKINYIYIRPQAYNNPYGNPYNNPYGNPYNTPYNNSGYGQNNNAQNAESIDEDPFPEFSNKTSGIEKAPDTTNQSDDLFD